MTKARRHPAEWSAPALTAVVDLVDEHVPERGVVLDPFAGTGKRFHAAIEATGRDSVGVELEPEWASQSSRTICGSSLDLLALFPTLRFAAVATSPCFGNRMADHHDAQDVCKKCGGVGYQIAMAGNCGADKPADPAAFDAAMRELMRAVAIREGAPACKTCHGEGLSWRNTYRAALGRAPSDDSAAVMQWGMAYRDFHRRWLQSVATVLSPNALVVVNMKNHSRGDDVPKVVEWWVNALLTEFDSYLVALQPVESKGNRNGANDKLRLDHEFVMAVRVP